MHLNAKVARQLTFQQIAEDAKMSRTLAAEQIKEGRPEADQIKADADLAKVLDKYEVKFAAARFYSSKCLQQMDAKLAARIAANEGKQLGGSQDVSPEAHQACEACGMMRQ